MKVAKTRNEVTEWCDNRPIGFVPTMGALHEGHLSLVRASKDRNLFTVVSIFVNPTQFNNPNDLAKYPVDTEADLEKLASVGCDLVFMPTVDEIYGAGMMSQRYVHSFGNLEQVFEGAYRPGHFRGVGQIVHILFEIVKPTVAFFGEKDFQQLAVVKELVRQMGVDIEIVGVATMRENDGLAMSSRNRRLTPSQRLKATLIYKMMSSVSNYNEGTRTDEIIGKVGQTFCSDIEWKLEYFDIIDEETFSSSKWLKNTGQRAIISAYLGDIRLIDNMKVTAKIK